jgi:hypothetical protein
LCLVREPRTSIHYSAVKVPGSEDPSATRQTQQSGNPDANPAGQRQSPRDQLLRSANGLVYTACAKRVNACFGLIGGAIAAPESTVSLAGLLKGPSYYLIYSNARAPPRQRDRGEP